MATSGRSAPKTLLCPEHIDKDPITMPMDYVQTINRSLVPRHSEKAVVLDLFAGCGGLALGFEAAGYRTIGFEMNAQAGESYC